MSAKQQYLKAWREIRVIEKSENFVADYMAWVQNWQGEQAIRQLAVCSRDALVRPPKKITLWSLSRGLRKIDSVTQRIYWYQQIAEKAIRTRYSNL